MGSILTWPYTLIVKPLQQIHHEIDGNWIKYLIIKFIIFLKIYKSENRFQNYDIFSKKGPKKQGFFPQDYEWDLERPNKLGKDESIFIYGTNSKRQLLTIQINLKKINADNRNLELTFELDQGDGIVYRCEAQKLISNSDDNYKYKTNEFSLEILNPFRLIRISFRGFLTKKVQNSNSNIKDDSSPNIKFAKIRLFWYNVSDVFDSKKDIDLAAISKQFARDGNTSIGEVNNIEFEDTYYQDGQLKGTVEIDGQSEEDIFLWGSRVKKFIAQDDNKIYSRTFGYSLKGQSYCLIKVLDKHNYRSLYEYGYSQNSNGLTYPIISTQNNQNGELVLSSTKKTFNIVMKDEIHQNFNELTINTHSAKCISIITGLEKSIVTSYKLNQKTEKPSKSASKLVLKFNDVSAKEVSVSGGKGASLCSIKSFVEQNNDKNYGMANGVILTTFAYKQLLDQVPEIRSCISSSEASFLEGKQKDFSKISKTVMDKFGSITLPAIIKEAIKSNLIETFGSDFQSRAFAVRSSASFEDSADMSSAGQMSTFLGVSNINDIFSAVLNCWGSQFSPESLRYKRTYGIGFNSPMAVVIQEMIDSEKAGVSFSCNPLSGDEREIIISANFGIGETVVSAMAEPDEISVNVEIDPKNKSRMVKGVKSIKIGSKKMMLKSKGVGLGTELQNLDDSVGEKCCLDENEILTISEAALKISKYFNFGPVDFEWGISNGSLYLLQVRPVTNLDKPNQWELLHEEDTGHNSECERFLKVSNFGGTGSMTPLGRTFMATKFNFEKKGFANYFDGSNMKQVNMYKFDGYGICIRNMFVSLVDNKMMKFPPKVPVFIKALNKAFYAGEINDDGLRIDATERSAPPSLSTIIRMIRKVLEMLIFSGRKMEAQLKEAKPEGEEILKEFMDIYPHASSKELIEKLYSTLEYEQKGGLTHAQCSLVSGLLNSLLYVIFSSENPNESEVLLDISNILTITDEVESAQIIHRLSDIAQAIDNKEQFLQMNDEDALKLLRGSNSEGLGKRFNAFLDTFGHHSTEKSLDMAHVHWRENPSLLIGYIKTIIKSEIYAKPSTKTGVSESEIFEKLKTKLPAKKLFILKKILLPLAKNYVVYRELSKAHILIRNSYYKSMFVKIAAKLCFEEGLTDEPDLMYYLTIWDLFKLFYENDKTVIAKAKSKKALELKVQELEFENLCLGPDIRPKNWDQVFGNSIDNLVLDSLSITDGIKGTTVCSGKVKGRVCVAVKLKDAEELKAGDILVTITTDVGWSPYFAMISALITENGGLLSHGSVIAREYGLPCIIGVKNASKLLKTGDEILLDADLGVIYKLN